MAAPVTLSPEGPVALARVAVEACAGAEWAEGVEEADGADGAEWAEDAGEAEGFGGVLAKAGDAAAAVAMAVVAVMTARIMGESDRVGMGTNFRVDEPRHGGCSNRSFMI